MEETMGEQAARSERLQDRINTLLRETPEEWVAHPSSDYLPDPQVNNFVRRLTLAAQNRGLNGVEDALDEFERLTLEAEPVRLKRALKIFLTHNPAAAQNGLHTPSLEETASWKTLPGQR